MRCWSSIASVPNSKRGKGRSLFTGIVEEIGRVRSIRPLRGGKSVAIDASGVLDGLRTGDSIAVDGACQTVVALDGKGFTVESIATTLSRTTLGSLAPGVHVNLERALALGARLGGHLVQGHVDAVGTVTAIEPRGEHVLLELELPDEVADVTVLHGSLAVHGVSLTVNAIPSPGRVQLALIRYTWEHTNLRHLTVSDRVNLEGDMIGRFVAHLLERRGDPAHAGSRPLEGGT
jgi:riboflavin synthase